MTSRPLFHSFSANFKLFSIKFLIAIAIVVIFTDCNGKSESDATINSIKDPIFIDISSMKNGELFYSDFVQEISYTKLETRTDQMIGEGTAQACPDGFLIDDNENELKVFSKEGKYLSTIGKLGEGPGEYPYANSPQIDYLNNKVYFQLSDATTMLMYSLSGNFINSFEVNGFPFVRDMLFANDRFYISGMLNYSDTSFQPLSVYNTTGLLQTSISLELPNDTKVDWTPSARFTLSSFGEVLIWNIYPDTIHGITKENKLYPYAIIDLEDKGLKYEHRFSRKTRNAKLSDAVKLYLVNDYSRVILFHVDRNDENFVAAYKKDTDELIRITNWDIEELHGLYGIQNDIDGGANIAYLMNDGQNSGYALISAFELINKYESGWFDEVLVKDESRKEELIQLIKTLKENDNPVVMTVKYKTQD